METTDFTLTVESTSMPVELPVRMLAATSSTDTTSLDNTVAPAETVTPTDTPAPTETAAPTAVPSPSSVPIAVPTVNPTVIVTVGAVQAEGQYASTIAPASMFTELKAWSSGELLEYGGLFIALALLIALVAICLLKLISVSRAQRDIIAKQSIIDSKLHQTMQEQKHIAQSIKPPTDQMDALRKIDDRLDDLSQRITSPVVSPPPNLIPSSEERPSPPGVPQRPSIQDDVTRCINSALESGAKNYFTEDVRKEHPDIQMGMLFIDPKNNSMTNSHDVVLTEDPTSAFFRVIDREDSYVFPAKASLDGIYADTLFTFGGSHNIQRVIRPAKGQEVGGVLKIIERGELR